MAKNGEGKRELPAGQRVQMNQRRVKMERICGREVWILSQWGFHGNLPTSSFFLKKALQTEGQQLVQIKIAKQALVCLIFPPHDV